MNLEFCECVPKHCTVVLSTLFMLKMKEWPGSVVLLDDERRHVA